MTCRPNLAKPITAASPDSSTANSSPQLCHRHHSAYTRISLFSVVRAAHASGGPSRIEPTFTVASVRSAETLIGGIVQVNNEETCSKLANDIRKPGLENEFINVCTQSLVKASVGMMQKYDLALSCFTKREEHQVASYRASRAWR